MHKIIAIALLAFSGLASAGTITLQSPFACGGLPACNNVPNDAGAVVSLGYQSSNGRVYAVVNGTVYQSQAYAIPSGVNTVTFTNVVCYADDGSRAFVTATITHTAVYVSRGRLHMWKQIYTLTDGSIELAP